MLIYDHKIEIYLEEIEHLSKIKKLWEDRKNKYEEKMDY